MTTTIYLAVWLGILSNICITTHAQSIPGFLSIDCGSSKPYNDSQSFLWETDDNYTFTGANAVLPDDDTLSATDNREALTTFRYFPVHRNKHCYDLPLTTSNISFLLRAMFLLGSPSLLTLPVSFDVTVNGTTWNTVSYGIYDTPDILDQPIVLEGIFHSKGSLTHVCLIPKSGVPFISSLELRLLDQDGIMYSTSSGDKVWLSSMFRFDCGAIYSTLRYPDDPFDRLWYVPGDWANSLQGLVNSTDNPSVISSAKENYVPPEVMKDAWLNDSANSSFQLLIPTTNVPRQIYVAVYTEEIETNYPPGSRVFQILMHSSGSDVSNVVAFGVKPTSNPSLESNILYTYGQGTNGVINFTFTASKTSLLGPIVNAIEAYGINPFDNSTTAGQDVYALADLQINFNLTDWQGDPCRPVPWDWVACILTDYSMARVTKLLLSNMGITSSIPPSISQLDALTEIHLNNNTLTGKIPDSLAALQNLTLLLLNDNNLSGEVPPDLVTKLGSNFSYSGNKLLGLVSPTGAPSGQPSSTGAPAGQPSSTGAPAGPPSSTTPGLLIPTKKKNSVNIGVIIAAVAGGILGVGAVIILACYLRRYFCAETDNEHHNDQDKTQIPPVSQNTSQVVPFEVVRIATDDFKEKIGQGSYGSVYHGWLNNREVAVKLNNIQSDQGHIEFMNEVDILTRVHHRNLVSLIGYCNEGQELILIYEYQINGTLREWLHDENIKRGSLDWVKRLEIAADGAKGLEYLHKGCTPTIIHRDVKSSNILLDGTLMAKVGDFGLSKTTPYENSLGLTTNVKGTPGYLDPEYHTLGRLTHKSDVYSYGVVLAEIITGRPPLLFQGPLGGPNFILLEWFRKMVIKNDIRALADPTLEGKFNRESMWRMVDIALECTNPAAGSRPDFTQVVQSINEAIEIESHDTSRKGSHVANTMYIDSSRTVTVDSPPIQPSGYFSIIKARSYRNLQP